MIQKRSAEKLHFLVDRIPFFRYSSHPEIILPDENTQQLAIIHGQKPFKKGFLARASCENPGVSIRKFEFPAGNSMGIYREKRMVRQERNIHQNGRPRAADLFFY